jgi:predicted nuclease with TOPRIM domain
MKNTLNELDELIKEYSDLEKEIITIEEKKNRIEKLKSEISIKEEHLKKSAFETLLNSFDKLLDLYSDHHIESLNVKTIEEALNTEMCTDMNPINVTTCKRCSLIYLQKYIEKEIANFYIM